MHAEQKQMNEVRTDRSSAGTRVSIKGRLRVIRHIKHTIQVWTEEKTRAVNSDVQF